MHIAARATARQDRYQNLLWVSWQSSRVFSQAIERAAESLLFFHALNAVYIKVKKRDMILNGNTLTPHINREVGLRKVQGRTSSAQQKVMAFQTSNCLGFFILDRNELGPSSSSLRKLLNSPLSCLFLTLLPILAQIGKILSGFCF